MEQLFLKLVNLSIAASWLVLLVLVLRLASKKVPKWAYCVLWGLVALRLLCPVSLTSVFSLIPSRNTIPDDFIYSPDPAIHTGVAFINNAVNPVISTSLAPSIENSANPAQVLVFVLSYLWAFGVVVMLAYALVSWLLLRRKVRTAVLSEDNIRLSEFVSSPFVLGLFRPVIYLPYSITDHDRPYVIAHEQAHIRRLDHVWKPLGYLLLSVYWFNPVLWAAYIFLCRDIESACDEKVIREMGVEELQSYSLALLNCSVSRMRIAACPLAFGETGVKTRIKNVMNYKRPAFWVVVCSVIVCAAAAVCFLTYPPEKGETPTVDRPTIIIDGVSYVDPYMPVSQLPYGYELQGKLTEKQANNTGLEGSEYYCYASTDHTGDFYTYQECGTPIGIDMVDSEEKQWAFVRWIPVNADAVASRRLTLDDVIMLAEKGDELTWSDFERFKGNEIGSGLLIMRYEIDDLFYLLIGGAPDEPPMYIRLCVNTEAADFIELREEDPAKFIEAHRNDTPKERHDEAPANETTVTEADVLEQYISTAIMERNAQKHQSDFACESHIVLGMESTAVSEAGSDSSVVKSVTAYITMLYEEYDFTENGIETVGGVNAPAVLTVERNENGTYELTEYWTPRDGEYYASDIEEKFGRKLAADAMSTQKYILPLKQSCYAQAVEFADLDTDRIIGGLLDKICSLNIPDSIPGAYVDLAPVEFRELKYYGDYTLRYCWTEFLKGGQTDLRGQIMRILCDTLAPELSLNYNIKKENGQEYFDRVLKKEREKFDKHGRQWMEEKDPRGMMLVALEEQMK